MNDTQGHPIGDAMIVEAARVLTTVFRQSDVVARFGGDEFVVLALVADTDAALAIRERLQASIDEGNQQAGRPYQLSLSVGIEELPSAADIALEVLIAHADQAMYAQKRENRQWPEYHRPQR